MVRICRDRSQGSLNEAAQSKGGRASEGQKDDEGAHSGKEASREEASPSEAH
jgi:hypothetical protein